MLFRAAGPLAAEPSSAERRRELGKKALGILQAAAAAEDSDVRVLAFEQWGEIGSEAAKPLLRRALKDESKYVRIAAAGSLYQLGDASGVESLRSIVAERPAKAKTGGLPLPGLEELKAMGRNKVRVAAIRVLAEMGASGARTALEKAKLDPDGGVRDAAAAALARLGETADLSRLIQALRDGDEGVRAAAVRALGHAPSPAALAAYRTLAKDNSVPVRSAVMDALGDTGDTSALEELTDGLNDENELVRSKAVAALGRLQTPAAAPLLKAVREKSAGAFLQLQASLGLARLGETPDLDLAEQALSQKDEDAKLLAVEVAEAAGGGRALAILAAAMEDASLRVRVRSAAAVIKTLRKNGGKKP